MKSHLLYLERVSNACFVPCMRQADVTTSSWLINIFQYGFIYSLNLYTEVGTRGSQIDLAECKSEEKFPLMAPVALL